MFEVGSLLLRCDPVLLDSSADSEPDCADAARTEVFLTDSRRVQNVLWRQLFVLDSMMSLLEGLESAQQLMMEQCPPQPGGGARGRWKALKAESRLVVEETESGLRTLQDRVQQVHDKRNALTQLVQQLGSQRRQCDQLETSLLKAQNALRSCDSQLIQLKAESEVVLTQLIGWQQLRDELQLHVAATQEVMQINLLTFNQSELCVELRPRPSCGPLSNDLEPLRLSISWRHNERFNLQVEDGMAGLMGSQLSGPRAELGATLLEVLQGYVGQAELLSEIQRLRSSFAIDWRPSQRLLIYLKSASLVFHLQVEEGYPRGGRARLLSVRKDGHPVDASILKPHRDDLSLTEWLVLLCSSPLT